MKNRIYLFTTAVLAALCALSCTKEISEQATAESQSGLVSKVFKASMTYEGDAAKSIVDGNKVIWREGDRLLVFDYSDDAVGKCSEGHIFNLTAGAGTSAGTFEGRIHNSDRYCAVVMNSERDLHIDGKVVETFIPSTQHPAGGTIEDKINPAYGEADEAGGIILKNLGVLVKVKVGASNIASIRLLSNDKSAMTGLGRFDTVKEEPSFNGTPDIPFVDLLPSEGEYFKAGETYCAIIYPASHSAGLTIEYRRNSEGKFQSGSYTSSQSLSLNRNNILNLGAPDQKITNWENSDDLLLDVRFNEDGSARDASSYNRVISGFGGVVAKYNRQFGDYIGQFDNEASYGSSSQFYRIDYSKDTQIKEAIRGNHSWEVYFMPNDTTGWWSSTRISRPFGATSTYYDETNSKVDPRGGSGIYMNSSKNAHTISFSTYNTTDKWKTLSSGVAPSKGVYHHVVATFDASTKTQTIYVDGVSKGSVKASALPVIPSLPEMQWIGVGAMPYKNAATSTAAFDGDIAIARFYGKTLSQSEVSSIYSGINKIDNGSNLLLDVKFNSDGSAFDASLFKRGIQAIGASPSVVYNAQGGLYTAQFNNTAGAKTNKGYYRMSYKEDPSFVNAMKDGFTVEVYAKSSGLPGVSQKIFGLTQGGGTEISFNKENKIVFEVYDSGLSTPGYVNVKTSQTITEGKYYHIVGVANPAEKHIRLYVDGVLIGTTAFTGPITFPSGASNSWLGIGADCYSSATEAEAALNGNIALMRVYDNAMSEESVAGLEKCLDRIEGETALSRDGMLLDVKFNAKGDAYDASGRHRRIERKEGFGSQSWFSSERNDYVACFTNKVSTSVKTGYFKYDYSTDPDFLNAVQNGIFSIETYMSVDATSSRIVKFLSAQEAGGFSMNVRTDGNFGFEVVTEAGTVVLNSGISPKLREYHHIIGTVDSSAKKIYLYIDGSLKASADLTSPVKLPASQSNWWLGIGADAGSSGQNCLYGEIAYAKVYDRALSAQEVGKCYSSLEKISDNTSDRPLKVSVIGGSIATFKGYIPEGYAAHYPTGDNSLDEVSQTYWWKFTYDKLSNAMLDTNISWSGSAMCNDGYKKDGQAVPCYIDRLLDYGMGNPDVILVHGSSNDWSHNLCGLYEIPGTKIKSATKPIPDDVLNTMYNNRSKQSYDRNYCGGVIRLLYEMERLYPKAKVIFIIGDYMNDAVYQSNLKMLKKCGTHYIDLYGINGYQDLGGKTSAPYSQPNMPKHDFDITSDSTSGCHPGIQATEFIAQKLYDEQHEYIEN